MRGAALKDDDTLQNVRALAYKVFKISERISTCYIGRP